LAFRAAKASVGQLFAATVAGSALSVEQIPIVAKTKTKDLRHELNALATESCFVDFGDFKVAAGRAS